MKPEIVRGEKTHHIHPDDRVPVHITIGDDITALTDTEVYVHCTATGIPKPTITWTKDSEDVSDKEGVSVLSNGTLLIRKATPEQRGLYTCTAKNIDGEDSLTSTVHTVGMCFAAAVCCCCCWCWCCCCCCRRCCRRRRRRCCC